MSALLQIAGLELGYGRTRIVKGIDLAVAEGTVVALIGANGAGKTTTMRGLSGLLRARAGSIRFAGVELAGAPAHRTARLGMVQVPEGRQLFADLSVAENLRLGAFRLRDAAAIRQRRDQVLDRFPRLAERLEQPTGVLSGGEQQMLALGRALMADPRLLLAPLFVEQIFAIIAALKREGRTILLVEQNAQAALAIADDAYVMENGRIALHGPSTAVAADPAVLKAYLGVE